MEREMVGRRRKEGRGMKEGGRKGREMREGGGGKEERKEEDGEGRREI